jgi:hypothetical protein
MPAPSRTSKGTYTAPKTLALPATLTVATPWLAVRGTGVTISGPITGTATGAFSLQSSDDGGVTPLGVSGSAAEFTNSPNAQPAGAPITVSWNFSQVPSGLIRVLYTATSGTGTFTYRVTWRD